MVPNSSRSILWLRESSPIGPLGGVSFSPDVHSPASIRSDLSTFTKERNQRRSRSGPKWKIVLRTILQGIIAGHCDLDILLDPIFLHFPRLKEAKTWYPGSSAGRTDIPNLVTALSVDDEAEPWKNHFAHQYRITPGRRSLD